MHSQTYTTTQSNSNSQIHNLHRIFNQKQIVQAFHLNNNHPLIYGGPHHKHSHLINTSDIMIEHQQIDIYNKKAKKFIQDDIFGQLNPGYIVENYSMLDQRDQIYQPYQNVFHGRGQKPLYMNQNMLASSSQNNDVPSRNSSLSSLSQRNHHIQRIKLNNSFQSKEFQKVATKNYVKNGINNTNNKRSSKRFYLGSSQNQMDIQHSPSQNKYNFVNHNHHHHYNNHSKFIHDQNDPFPTKQALCHNSPQLYRHNSIINPQKVREQFPIFKRLDIDDQQQKKQRLQKIQKLQQIGCNCKKSKCLKMYCQCFNLQIFCNQNCNCNGCCNQQSNNQHKKAVLDALTRNPKAFNQVTQKIDVTFNLGVQLNQVKKGCKCKKTKCQKKYCQCYNVGQTCGKFCKCQGCENC